jgi:hypothetical protein
MRRPLYRLLAIALVAGLAGCGGKPMSFPVPESQLGDRPGLFTGEHGDWRVYPGQPPQPQPQPR